MSKRIKKEQSQGNKKLEFKKKTADYIDTMIRNAEKGPSGFWTEDYEGCGNPDIFPEFNEGLTHGRLIQKEHFLCPWNTAVLFGEGRGNISTGCYHSCSIKEAKYLSAEMIEEVLIKFKKNMMDGKYDSKKDIEPLLSNKMKEYIESAKIVERKAEEKSVIRNMNYERKKPKGCLKNLKMTRLHKNSY